MAHSQSAAMLVEQISPILRDIRESKAEQMRSDESYTSMVTKAPTST